MVASPLPPNIHKGNLGPERHDGAFDGLAAGKPFGLDGRLKERREIVVVFSHTLGYC